MDAFGFAVLGFLLTMFMSICLFKISMNELKHMRKEYDQRFKNLGVKVDDDAA